MKYTILELDQAILSSLDSDEVNSIGDSVESLQVVEILKTVYDDIISRGDLRSNKIPFNLVSYNDPTKPVIMTKPSNIDRIDWIKYNVMKASDLGPIWNTLRYLNLEDFLDYTHAYNESEPNIDTFSYTSNTFTLSIPYRNDTAPQYYTSLDDNVIIFDAYDSRVDDTLQTSKTLGFGSKTSDFVKEDNFIPNLQPQQFALLLNEAKSLAWTELKQTPHPKAEVSARRNWRHLQKTRQTIPDGLFDSNSHTFDTLPDFARRRRR